MMSMALLLYTGPTPWPSFRGITAASLLPLTPGLKPAMQNKNPPTRRTRGAHPLSHLILRLLSDEVCTERIRRSLRPWGRGSWACGRWV